VQLVKNEIDHWSKVEDKAGIERSKENIDHSQCLLQSWSLIEVVLLALPLDRRLVSSGQNILQITIIVSSDNIRVVDVVNRDKNCHGNVTLKHSHNSSLTEEYHHIGYFKQKAEQHLDQTKGEHQVWVFKLVAMVVHKLHHCHGVYKELVEVHMHHGCTQEHCNENVHGKIFSG
jgi:hypothetical protein